MADDGNTRTYNALVLSVQRRRAKGITVQGNYTYSHCIDDGYNDVIQNTGGQIQSRRGANRGNCELDRRHNFNMSTVYETPRFGSTALRVLASGWQISGIVRAVTGAYLSVSSGTDVARAGTIPPMGQNTTSMGVDQRPNQILPSPYVPNKGSNSGCLEPSPSPYPCWLNPFAFGPVALGSYGSLGSRNIAGPGSIRIDMGLTRSFAIKEKQSLQLRAEAFNVANHVNYCAPPFQGIVPVLNCPDNNFLSSTFGKLLNASDPRVMQMALKYIF